MIVTHVGYGKEYNDYKFEVLKQGSVYTLNVEKNGEYLESSWHSNMTDVRRRISGFVRDYTLDKIDTENDE